MKSRGVYSPRGKPGSGIVGASGLLLGLGKLYDIKAVCLMGRPLDISFDPKGVRRYSRILRPFFSRC